MSQQSKWIWQAVLYINSSSRKIYIIVKSIISKFVITAPGSWLKRMMWWHSWIIYIISDLKISIISHSGRLYFRVGGSNWINCCLYGLFWSGSSLCFRCHTKSWDTVLNTLLWLRHWNYSGMSWRYVLLLLLLLLLLQPFYDPLSGTTRVSRYEKDKPFWIMLKQRWWGGSSISWTICKLFALRSSMPAPHHSDFPGPDALPDTQPRASKRYVKNK